MHFIMLPQATHTGFSLSFVRTDQILILMLLCESNKKYRLLKMNTMKPLLSGLCLNIHDRE